MNFKRIISSLLIASALISVSSCKKPQDNNKEEAKITVPAGNSDAVKPDSTTPANNNETLAPIVSTPISTVAPVQTTAPNPVTPTVTTNSVYADTLAQYPQVVLPQTADAGQAYLDKIVFLGDSTTYGLRYYAKLTGGKDTLQVWTPQSGTLTLNQATTATIVYPETNEQITVVDAVTRKKPEILVITLGVNGVSFMDEAYFKSSYKKLLQAIQMASPSTKIICQSIFPVCRSYKNLSSINNDKIKAANNWIIATAAECGVKFIDTYSLLIDAEGWMPEEYHNGDGLHLNSSSFDIELYNIKTHAWQ